MVTLNGVAVKSPRKMAVAIMDIGSSGERNAAGATLIDRVATKRKIDLEWGPLTNAQASAILTAVTAVFFDLTYPDPQTGANRTIVCHVGERSAPMVRNYGGLALWEGLKMTLMEQ